MTTKTPFDDLTVDDDDVNMNYEYEEGGEHNKPAVEDLEKRFLEAALGEMYTYIRESDDLDLDCSPENVSTIYVTNRPYETTTVIVEFEEVPDDFRMQNQDLREFLWWPEPAFSNQPTAAYFQYRQG